MSEVNNIQGLVGVYNPDRPPVRKSQVYQLTHDGVRRTPYYKRAFISFSYGGKWIEDFGFITITQDNKISRPLYADFKDNVTESEVFDGQIFWDSHYNANELTLPLFTDGVTEQQLESFKMWFKPGKVRLLILALHPNRAIMARVASVPDTGLLPFETKETKLIAGSIPIEVKTTMYRGSISIKFTMDDPHWYSKLNVLDLSGSKLLGYVLSEWRDANNELITMDYTNLDIKKIILEDNMPTLAMAYDDVCLATSTSDNTTQYAVVTPRETPAAPGLISINTTDSVILFGIDTNINLGEDDGSSSVDSARVDSGRVSKVLDRAITDLEITIGIGSIVLNQLGSTAAADYDVYAYYAGTAPCTPLLQFKMYPGVVSSGIPYITCPYNNIHESLFKSVCITFESEHKYEFKFTTPSIWTGYNQAIKILADCIVQDTTYSFENIRLLIRNNVKHYAPRQFAINVIDNLEKSVDGNSTWSNANTIESCRLAVFANMKQFLQLSEQQYYPATFKFNTVTGEATGIFKFNKYEKNNDDLLVITVDTSEEDVGDMLKSNYLKLEDRNVPSLLGYIEPYDALHPQYSYKIYHNATEPLYDFKLLYKYKYL